MNKIFVGDIGSQKDLSIKEDTILIIDKNNENIDIEIESDVKVFVLILFSNIKINYNTAYNTELNIFTVDSSTCLDINLMKDNIIFNYFYGNINNDDNDYKININHLGNNIKSKITNHGINTSNNKLSYTINTVVPKEYINIKTSQDSKIIVLKDNNATIKPNLLIDNDDIEANHAAYIGRFKEEEIFYLMTRGITRKDATDLLVRSFLIGDMNLSSEEKELILEKINEYWR